ncbi:class I SAM-dependent methyltransferase [Niveispirillum sp.]|uniref:class I SAM-dependent methyltransferase n=1 Tax=Niveispirillum sp. TaxID=1917217 RepID=UPI001B64A510|nr:class I SAM-dependent methyltransferase [Niveispirillum sp.]MBP7338073.1 class I SAM-dependent methyltransferase [Niveispirillum sp.]
MPTEWSDGYVAEINYVHGFYRELSPGFLALGALAATQSAPDPTQPLHYCELGCGQGLTTNLLAAVSPHIQFYANDFNPSQIAGARALAAEAGITNVHFMDSSFAEMAERTDLPDFDIIVLHGIYSWVSAENRQAIVRFIARRLKVGGLVYISYNSLPGWAALMPLRRLLVDNADLGNVPILKRIDQALKAADALAQVNARYFANNPGTGDRLKEIATKARSYIAHEYFNREWTPFYHADVVSELSAAKLTWIAPARPFEGIENLIFTPEQLGLLAGVEPASRREGIKDYILNQQFRRDLFVKGPLPLQAVDADARWKNTSFILSAPISNPLDATLTTPLGQIGVTAEGYLPLMDRLAKGPVTGDELAASFPHLPLRQICQALSILVSLAYAHPCVPLELATAARSSTDRFNRAVLARSRLSGDIGYLASPLIGSALAIDQMNQMLLSAFLEGGGVDAVGVVWAHMRSRQQRLVRNGQMLMEEEDNLAELRQRFDNLVTNIVPSLKNLWVV